MRHSFLVLCTLFLLISAKTINQLPAQPASSAIMTEKIFVVHSFHVTLLGSNSVYYVVQIDFNLSTQQFGVISCHTVSNPGTELPATYIEGVGTTVFGNGSTIRIIEDLVMSTTGGVTFTLPASSTNHPFDY